MCVRGAACARAALTERKVVGAAEVVDVAHVRVGHDQEVHLGGGRVVGKHH